MLGGLILGSSANAATNFQATGVTPPSGPSPTGAFSVTITRTTVGPVVPGGVETFHVTIQANPLNPPLVEKTHPPTPPPEVPNIFTVNAGFAPGAVGFPAASTAGNAQTTTNPDFPSAFVTGTEGTGTFSTTHEGDYVGQTRNSVATYIAGNGNNVFNTDYSVQVPVGMTIDDLNFRVRLADGQNSGGQPVFYNGSIALSSVVPEPGSLALLLSGLAPFGIALRRRSGRAKSIA